MLAVARHSAVTAAIMAGFLLLSALGALFRNEAGADVFVMTALLTLAGAGAVYLSVRNRAARLDRRASYGLLLVLWVGLPVIAALPIAATTPLSPIEAWLEAVSAFTTTGPVQIHGIDGVPRVTLGWLLTLQWAGGLLTLVGVVAVLGPAGIGGLPDRSSRVNLLGMGESMALDDALHLVLPIYLGATVLCAVLLFFAGVKTFDAIGLAGAALSTGGLLPDADGVAAYGHFAVKLVLMVFMLVGGTSVLWHRMLVTRRLRLAVGQQENSALLLVCLVVGIGAAAIAYNTPSLNLSVPMAIEDGLFTAVSLITTTAIEPHGGAFASLPLSLVMVLVFIGGASFSTAGGIKMYRAGTMFLQSYLELERLVHPHAVRTRRLGQQGVTLQMMKAIWIMFGVACTVIAGFSAAIAPAMPSFEAALVSVVSALSNAGPVYAIAWQSAVVWPDWGSLPAYAQIILAIAMILGRLEILVVLGLANFAFWRR
ncbi:trk system potassium uptake protein TrkH [Angulomicrobium tetraedrale]|uniref:Trk system potassium uptake protein TrkH n=1 Tax=Ancylobacter tetraedralis TaxID=217068 RepID=A0A839Z6L2_9HYPH|nr:TrkH family potassium uptake protein [Ancylobacter tetraedralis]MBB3771329.1 trk system potassium uptake protein TrkH [Ancylobacter tetraedralis]